MIINNFSELLWTFSGCVGGVCALANVLGRETCELYALAKQGKTEEAKTLQHKLIGPNTAVSIHLDIRPLVFLLSFFIFIKNSKVKEFTWLFGL